MDFDTTLKNTLSEASKKGVNSDGLKQLSQKLISDYQSQQKSLSPVSNSPLVSEPESPGWGKKISDSIAKPFLKVGYGLTNFEAGLISSKMDTVSSISKAFGLNEFSNKVDYYNDRLSQKVVEANKTGKGYGADFEVKPIGSAFANEDYSTTEKVVRSALDTAGTAGEIGTYFIGMPEAKASGFLPKAWEAFKKIQPTAIAFSASLSAQAAGEGKGAKDVAETALATYAGTVIGNQLIHGVAQAGGKLAKIGMSTSLGKVISEKATDFAQHLYEMFPEKFQSAYKAGNEFISQKYGKQIEAKYAAAKDDFNTMHKEVINDISQSNQTSIDVHAIYNQAQTEANAAKNALYNEVRQKYSGVWNSGAKVNPGATAGEIEGLEKEIVTATIKSKAPEIGKPSSKGGFTPEQIKAQQAAESGPRAEEQNPFETVSDYINRVKSVIYNADGSLNGNVDIQEMYAASMNTPALRSGTPEHALVTSLKNKIYQDIENSLSHSPEILAQLKQARIMSEHISNNIDTETTKGLLESRTPQSFADKFFDTSSKPSDLENTLSLLSPKNRQTMREFIVNQMFEAGNKANDKSAAATKIGEYLDKYEGTNILRPDDVSRLRDYQNVLDRKLDDFMGDMNHVMDPEGSVKALGEQQQVLNQVKPIVELAKAGNYSEIAPHISKMKSVEQVKTIYSMLSPEEQSVLTTHIIANKMSANTKIYNINENGKYNFSGFLNQLDSIGGENKESIGKVIFDKNPELKKNVNNLVELLKQQKDIENIPKTKALALIHGAASLLHLSLGHPVGASIQGSKSIMGAFGGGERISTLTEEQLYKMYLETGAIKPNILQKALTAISNGIAKSSNKTSSVVTGVMTKDIQSPQPPDWFNKEAKARGYEGDINEAWDTYNSHLNGQ